VEPEVLSDDELVVRVQAEPQILCIVNTRRHAAEIFNRLDGDEGAFHLSGLMCPAHRSHTLATIRGRLDRGEPCRVVSTQLIEAGVDIDFPVVYRSMAGLDSIAQAAGRCNRNGALPVGRTVVFASEHGPSEAFLRDTAAATREVIPLHADLLSLDAVEQYFRLYYWDQSARWDSKHILDEFHLQQDIELPFLFGFARTAQRFRLIDDGGLPIIIPWGAAGQDLCEQLRNTWEGGAAPLLRKLQRYTVQIPRRVWERHARILCEMVHDRYAVLNSPDLHYSDQTGLSVPDGPTDLLLA